MGTFLDARQPLAPPRSSLVARGGLARTMRAAAVARAPPPSRPAAAPPARPTPRDGGNGGRASGGRASGGRARVGGPPRVVHLARASSRNADGVGPSGDDASPNARPPVAGTTVKRGPSNALSDGDDDDGPSMDDFGKRDDAKLDAAVRLAPFDVDDATSSWVLCRFFFIWVAFGYVAVPAYALLVDAPVTDLPPKTQSLCLLFSELGKLIAANAMLDAELGPTQTPRRRCFASADKDAFPLTTRIDKHDVKLGLKCGALASVAARAADLVFSEIPRDGNVVSAAASSALDLFASLRFDPAALAAALIASTLVAPLTEELFFRGFLLPAIKRRAPFYNGAFAAAVTALVFAAFHFQPEDFPALFVAGAVFGAASLGSQKPQNGLVAPIIAHATFNASVLAEYLLS